MKRLLAMLLALLLPLCASAETWGVSLSVEADEEAFVSLISQAMALDPSIPAEEAERYAALLHRVMNGLGVEISADDEGSALIEVLMGGGKLLDITAYESDEGVFMTTSLLPGYVLVDEAEAQAEDQALQAELEAIDWDALAAGVLAEFSAWASVIEPSVSRGAFDGDAYAGGTKCTTWMLGDMDIAALADALLTDDVRAALSVMLKAMALDADALLAQLDEANDRVADEDRYLYLLRLVENNDGQMIGASLTVLEENAQVATLSLGGAEDEIRLVVGLGLDKQNYWWEFTADIQAQDNVTTLQGVSREWMASKDDGFSWVYEETEPVYSMDWQCTVTDTDSGCTWEAGITSGEIVVATASGMVDGESLECRIGLGDASASPLTVKLSASPAEAIPAMADGLIQCSVSNPEDAAAYEELVQKMSAALLARLIKLLPMDLLLTMNELPLGQ